MVNNSVPFLLRSVVLVGFLLSFGKSFPSFDEPVTETIQFDGLHKNESTLLHSNVTSSHAYGVLLHGNASLEKATPSLENLTAQIRGLEIEGEATEDMEWIGGISSILSGYWSQVRLFGDGFTNYTIIRFVYDEADRGVDCDDFKSTNSFHLDPTENASDHSVVYDINLPQTGSDEVFYICAKESNIDMPWVHQGGERWVSLKTHELLLPVPAKIILLCIFLVLSGLLSGLNLGLMALDPTQLKIILSTGTPQEKKHAKIIYPIRARGNYLLCSLLLGNVMVNASLTAILDEFFSGVIAVFGSTLSIVVFGEIGPQAFCSRFGLAVGAKTVWITKLLMLLTFPVSYPVSLILDYILGEEIGSVYTRERLKELIKVTHAHHDLEVDEENIISGALELKQKKVTDVMTTIHDTFMLPINAVLDFDTLSTILDQGYSRVPVYEGYRANIVSLLYTKDLAFVDPEYRMTLRTICEFYDNPINLVYEDTTLDVLFKEFRQGDKGHLAFVRRLVIDGDDKDPKDEIIGVITLEDIIEALIKSEINDERDFWDENLKRNKPRSLLSYSMGDTKEPKVPWKTSDAKITLSPQLNLAAFQFLSTALDPFKEENISKTILQKLLNQDIIFQIKQKSTYVEAEADDEKPNLNIYERGKKADYFVLILEGRVKAEMGEEGLVFESGPFTYFGVQSLGLDDGPSTPVPLRKFTSNKRSQSVQLEMIPKFYSKGIDFIPDYSVVACTDVIFMKISRAVYMSARQATVLEKMYQESGQDGEIPSDHFEKMMMLAHANDELNNHRRPSEIQLENRLNKKNEVLSELILTPANLLPSKSSKGVESRNEEVEVKPPKPPKPSNQRVIQIKDEILRRNSYPDNINK